jgi:hypothetical protein
MGNLKNASLPLLFLIGGCNVLLFIACSPKKDPPKNFQIIGYLYNKKIDLYKLPYKYLTVINYSFAVPAPDSSRDILPVPFPDRLNNLSNTAHNHGVKVFGIVK